MSYATGDSLKVRIRIAFGASIAANPGTWVWTDVTAWWHTPDDVTISWGRSSGAEQPETSTFSATLKNTDGRFTAYDPRSPYWPNVRKWTPISYDIDLGDGAGWRNRFSGFIRRWPLTWPGASPLMALAKIEAVGVLGRLGRGKPPARSPLRRTIAASALAYWPAEDGDAATAAGSAFAGHAALKVTGGVPSFADITDLVTGEVLAGIGTQRLADLSGGAQLSAVVPATATAGTGGPNGWSVMLAVQLVDITAIVGDVILLDIATPGGTYVRWQMVIHGLPDANFGLRIQAYNASGTVTTVIPPTSFGIGYHLNNMSIWQNGGNISVGYRWFGSGWEATGSVPGTVGGITQIGVNTAAATSAKPMPVGHIAVWGGHPVPSPVVGDVADGFTGVWPGAHNGAEFSFRYEPAHLRLARLAAEDGVPLAAMPAVDADAVTRMGWQKPGTGLELYQQCETTEQGLIYESGFGLGYLPRGARYNAAVALTIDASLGQLGMPFEPVDDDQMLRNRWTVERIDGSSAVADDDESIDLQGEIEGSATINLVSDDPLPDHAGWRVHLSTVQEPRYPALSINLAAHPELAAAWASCTPGSRIQVVSPPAQNVPGTVDQLVVGASETYRGRRSWRATLNVVPASPWQVATADGEQRVAADGTVLAAAISTATALSFQITSTAANGPWTTEAADFPLLVRVGGEVVRVSGISGAGLTQTATVSTRGVNDAARAWPAGTPVDVAEPAIAAL